jgi:tol-pal system protein YbgF
MDTSINLQVEGQRKELMIPSWGKIKFILCCLGLGMLCTFSIGCATHQEVMDLKPHVNKAILQVNDLSNQVYDMDNRLRRLENRETETPDSIRRLADLEVKLNSLQEEVHGHFTAEQDDTSLWKKFDQKFQRLSQELEDERKRNLQFQEEARKKLQGLPSQPAQPEGLTSQGNEPEKTEISESATLQNPSPGTTVPGIVPGTPVPVAPAPRPVGKTDDKSSYEDAYESFLREDWAAAQKKFSAFLDRYPKSDYADNAQFWIGETFYNQKNFEKAILEYEKVIQNYPQGDKLVSALLKQAISFQAIGRLKEAKILLRQVIEKAPGSDQALTAKKKLETIAKEEKAAR